MIEDYRAAGFWFDFGQTMCMIFLFIYTAWSGKNKVTSKKITDLDKKYQSKFDEFSKKQEKKCNSHHQRTAKIEVEISKAPTHRDLGEIHEKINEVNGSMEKMSGLMEGLSANVKMIHEYLLSKEKE